MPLTHAACGGARQDVRRRARLAGRDNAAPSLSDPRRASPARPLQPLVLSSHAARSAPVQPLNEYDLQVGALVPPGLLLASCWPELPLAPRSRGACCPCPCPAAQPLSPYPPPEATTRIPLAIEMYDDPLTNCAEGPGGAVPVRQ